jgi:hypothetical protein
MEIDVTLVEIENVLIWDARATRSAQFDPALELERRRSP